MSGGKNKCGVGDLVFFFHLIGWKKCNQIVARRRRAKKKEDIFDKMIWGEMRSFEHIFQPCFDIAGR